MSWPTGETVTFIRRVQDGEDRYGNPTWTWVETDVPDCAVAPRATEEPVQNARQAVITGMSVYAPHDAPPLGPYDQVRVRGSVWQVDGDIGDWRSPYSGWLPGLEIHLKRVEG